MDTRMLEVVIGLALVLAVASLLASVVHEIWVAFSGRRGDVLALGVCSLLGEDQVVSVWRSRRAQTPPSPFAAGLMQHPLLVTQVLGNAAKIAAGKSPSYLDSRVFVQALLAYGSERAGPGAPRPASPADWVKLMLQPSAHQTPASPALLRNLQAVLGGVESDWPAFEVRLCAWFNSVMDRASGWFQRDTQFRLACIGTALAILFNLNPFVIVDRLWNDPLARAFFTDASAVTLAIRAAEPAASAASAPEEAKPAKSAKPAKAAAAASAPPDTAQTQSVSRALRQLKADTLGQLKVNSDREKYEEDLRRVTRLEQHFDNLDADLQRRRQSWRAGASSEALLRQSVLIEDGFDALCLLQSDKPDEAEARREWARLRSLLISERNEQLRQTPLSAHSLCRESDGPALLAACRAQLGSERSGLGQLPLGWSPANWPGCDAGCRQRHQLKRGDGLQQAVAKDSDKPAQALLHQMQEEPGRTGMWTPLQLNFDEFWGGILVSLFGWVSVGVACVLGANFWFDLLSKVAKLRAAGLAAKEAAEAQTQKPEASTAAPAAKVEAGGVLTRNPGAPAPTPTPAGRTRKGRVPQYANGDVKVLSDQQVRDLYGDIRTKPAGGGAVTLTNPGVGAAQLRTTAFSHPLLPGKVLQVHELAKPHFEAVFNAIESAGLGDRIRSCAGTLALRHIGGNPLKELSHHCWGIAIDLNSEANGYGVEPPAVGQMGSVRELVPLFNRYGFAWGGHFRNRLDGMHFELALLDPRQTPEPLEA